MRAKEFTINESVNLFEINMSPSSLRQLASGIDARAGMEFEMIVPNVAGGDNSKADYEPDYGEGERAISIQQVVDFFDAGEDNTRRQLAHLNQNLIEDYQYWLDNNFDPSDSEIIDGIIDFIDDTDVRYVLELPDDAEISKGDYREAAGIIRIDKSGEYHRYYDDVMDSLRDDWYSDDREEEFLRDTNPFMTDIEQNYDISWPYYTTSYDGSGQDISEVASNFEAAIGRPVDYSESYHSTIREPNTYVVEPDSSLLGSNEGDRGLEFVSPPLPIAEMISDLQKVRQWAGMNGCYTNSSTGLHINVSIVGLDGPGDGTKLDYVKLALLLGDEHVLSIFNRSGNTYAKSAMQKIRSIVKSKPEIAEKMLDQMRSHLSSLASKAIHSGITEKFVSIHPKDGYIEFRSPGGDWLSDGFFDHIESTLLRFVVALDAAMDPNKYRQEYLTKLYKLLQVQSVDDPMVYFAKHAAGQLPTSALKSFIRQLQRTRASQPAAQNFGPVTGEDAWVILADGVPQFRIRAKTQQEASTKAREWMSDRSYEWRVEHSGQNIEVVPYPAAETQTLLRQHGQI